MIVVIDYGAGNLRSVAKAIEFLGKKPRVSDSASLIKKAKKLILPGVGHFGTAVKQLKKRGIFGLVRERIKEGVPFLGICVGMQLLLEESEEAKGVKGLGVISGTVKKFCGKNLVVPHMGWNQIVFADQKEQDSKKFFRGIKEKSFFYFAHSYYCVPRDKEIICTTTNYGVSFASSFCRDNLWAVQFHPEKSQKLGLKVFNNFLEM